jgi:hypothetical protein
MAKKEEHLWRGQGTPEREEREFEARYGSGRGRTRSGMIVPNKGDYIYGAVVGNVKREREAKGRRRRR